MSLRLLRAMLELQKRNVEKAELQKLADKIKAKENKVYRLHDYSYHRGIDEPWTGKYSFCIHDNEDWQGGLPVTFYMEGVNFYSENFNGLSKSKRKFCDTIVKSIKTGKLYYTRREFIQEI